jgi:O-succinylbenzoate synthase
MASLVKIVTTDGVVGWGEDVSPNGVMYVGDSSQESFASLQKLAELAGRRTIDVEEMFSEFWWGVDGHNFAKHALESALWDAHARTLGISLKDALGGIRNAIAPGVVIGIHSSIEELEVSVRARMAEEYRRIKLKVQPGWDVDVVRHIRNVVGDQFVLQVDANGAYRREDIKHLCQLEEFNIQLLEQPFAADDVESHVALSASTSTPICLDESIMKVSDLMTAIEMKACSVVNIKPSRVGGICDAVRLQEIATTHGLDAWVGGMLETGIGRASCLTLASRAGFTLTPDLSASSRYFANDVTEPFVLTNGEIAVPNTPGIGVVPLPWVFEHPEVKIETLYGA